MNDKAGVTQSSRTVFLDTQVFVQQNFQYARGLLEVFRLHVAAGRLRHVTTDITVKEIQNKIANAVDSAQVALRRFQTDARVLRNLPQPSIAQFFKKRSRGKMLRVLLTQLDSFLEAVETTVLSTDSIKPSAVFARYFSKEPPFSDPKKPSEFRDAFSMEALMKYGQDNGCEITVVSNDPALSEIAAVTDIQ